MKGILITKLRTYHVQLIIRMENWLEPISRAFTLQRVTLNIWCIPHHTTHFPSLLNLLQFCSPAFWLAVYCHVITRLFSDRQTKYEKQAFPVTLCDSNMRARCLIGSVYLSPVEAASFNYFDKLNTSKLTPHSTSITFKETCKCNITAIYQICQIILSDSGYYNMFDWLFLLYLD